jgi:hypothetical protein
MKFIKLTTSAYVNGVLRHPHEGALHLENDEADRLVKDKVAEDVTEDFSAKENKETPVETVTVAQTGDPEKKENRK